MPIYHRRFEPGQRHFITTSTYRRTKLPEDNRFRWSFVDVLRQVRLDFDFLLIAWVLMPEHFHLLLKPVPPHHTSRFIQELKKRSSSCPTINGRYDILPGT